MSNDKYGPRPRTGYRNKNSHNKMPLILMLAAALAVLLSSAASWAVDPPCSNAPGEVEVWASAVPVVDRLPNLADHTYVKACDRDNQQQSWGCFGRDSDGNRLNLSYDRSAALGTNTIGFMASQRPCKWPLRLYLTIGVCHQLSNRGLYTAHTTVIGARAYGLSRWFFGPYGRTIPLPFVWNYRMANCRAQAPAPVFALARSGNAGPSPKNESKEYSLFQNYLGELIKAEKEMDAEKQYKLMNQYRRKVLSWHLDDLEVSKKTKKKVLDFYDKTQPTLKDLMTDMMNKKISKEQYIKSMNERLRNVQDFLKKILGKDDYKSFTNAPFDKTLIWQDFMDKSTRALFP